MDFSWAPPRPRGQGFSPRACPRGRGGADLKTVVTTVLELSRQIIGYRPCGNVFVIAQFAARLNRVFRPIFRPERILCKLIFAGPYKSLSAHPTSDFPFSILPLAIFHFCSIRAFHSLRRIFYAQAPHVGFLQCLALTLKARIQLYSAGNIFHLAACHSSFVIARIAGWSSAIRRQFGVPAWSSAIRRQS